jgi:hypothetical protein
MRTIYYLQGLITLHYRALQKDCDPWRYPDTVAEVGQNGGEGSHEVGFLVLKVSLAISDPRCRTTMSQSPWIVPNYALVPKTCKNTRHRLVAELGSKTMS